MHEQKKRLGGKPLEAAPITGRETTEELLRSAFLSYGGREVRYAYDLIRRAVAEDCTIVLTVSGAMTPADLARSSINPLLESGIIDIVCTTGANLYHDAHRSLGFVLEEGSPFVDDHELREEGIIRIYDIFFTEDVLLKTDSFFSRIISGPDFQRSMTTPEFHHLLGRYMDELEARASLPIGRRSLLSTCYRNGVPVFCGAPQDGSIFLNVVKLRKLLGPDFRFSLDLAEDVYEYAAYQYWAKNRGSKKMAVIILGGGVPKNYTLQGEPLLGQIFFIDTDGFDIDVQISDANVHTGGLSGCPASEGHTWGKTSAECIINSVFCHGDVTQIFPLVAHGLLQKGLHKEPRRFLDHREEVMAFLDETFAARRDEMEEASR